MRCLVFSVAAILAFSELEILQLHFDAMLGLLSGSDLGIQRAGDPPAPLRCDAWSSQWQRSWHSASWRSSSSTSMRCLVFSVAAILAFSEVEILQLHFDAMLGLLSGSD